MASKVSFTIRPPTTSSKPSTDSPPPFHTTTLRSTSFIPHAIDSSDEDEEDGAIEPVIAFDQSGAQRLHNKPKPSGPLVIPALANRDWRAVARLRKQSRFIPDGAAAVTGKDGSQGGLGTRDSINSSPHATGLVIRKKVDSGGDNIENGSAKAESYQEFAEAVERVEEDDDDRARRALLASIAGGTEEESMTIDAIPIRNDDFHLIDETDAYKQDIVTRPDSATLADYERVPVSQFGAALLRGMGWKEGTAASRTRPGLVEPWLPPSRPALLGIGAKERPQEDIPPTGKGGFVSKRPDKRYVPVVKLQREGSELPPSSRSRSRSPVRSGTVSRVPSSKSASPYPGDHDTSRRRHKRDRDRIDDEPSYGRSGRGSDRESRDSDRVPDRDRRRERGDKDRPRDHRRVAEGDEWTRKGLDHKHGEEEGYSRGRRDRY